MGPKLYIRSFDKSSYEHDLLWAMWSPCDNDLRKKHSHHSAISQVHLPYAPTEPRLRGAPNKAKTDPTGPQWCLHIYIYKSIRYIYIDMYLYIYIHTCMYIHVYVCICIYVSRETHRNRNHRGSASFRKPYMGRHFGTRVLKAGVHEAVKGHAWKIQTP